MKQQALKNIIAQEIFENRICESLEDKEILEFFCAILSEDEEIKPLFEKFLWGEPISVPELRKLLRKKIINFEFIKIDGDIRPARGTTMMKYIPTEDQPKGIRPSSDTVAAFWDLQKKAWRSVSKKSKEIVLKKDGEKDRPIVVVQDKDKVKKKQPDPDRLGPEPDDDLRVGDVRNYLNRNNRNILIKITRMDQDGSVYAETIKEKTPFIIPRSRMRNIGELAPTPREKEVQRPIVPVRPAAIKREQPIAPEEPAEMKPVTPETPEGEQGEIIEIIPQEDIETKEPPEEVDDKDDAEELIK